MDSSSLNFFKYPEATQVIVCGDIHGNFNGIVNKLCVQYGCTNTLLIVAGDCGFGFDKPAYYEQVYNKLAGRLRKANNWVVFVRGNHDDPAYFAEERIRYARWRTVPDYTVISAAGHEILCIGGATSIDRVERMKLNARYHVKDVSYYWPDEAPRFDGEAIASLPDDMKIDTVVTHTAPSFCELSSYAGLKSWAKCDEALPADVRRERETMDKIFAELKAKGCPVRKWLYGHFHQSWNGLADGVQFTMLDIEEFKGLD